MKTNLLRNSFLAILSLASFIFTRALASPAYHPIAGFTLPSGDSRGTLVSDGAGNLWGTTNVGGPDGTVFKVNESTGAITTVLYFDGSKNSSDNARGANPQAGLVGDGAGNLWGTTSAGGASGKGTVFRINESTGAIATVVDFDASTNASDNARGFSPQAALVSDGAGSFWGTTTGGGVHGQGTVFKVNESTGAITTVADFDGSTNTSDSDRGADPQARLASDGAGNFWSTTHGGGASGNGTVFKVNVSTGAVTTMVDFDDSANTTDNARGGYPYAGLVSDGAGNLWGTTYYGGAGSVNGPRNAGTVYKVNISTGAITTIVDFGTTLNSPVEPIGDLVSDGAGNLWGTSQFGGANSNGTVFEVNVSTGAMTSIVNFDSSTSPSDNLRGGDLFAGLVSDGAGDLWGTTTEGGAYEGGTVFKVNVSTGATMTTTDIGFSPVGYNPNGGLVSDGAGNLWGTTSGGGPYGDGTVFKANLITGAITTVVNFDGSTSMIDNARGFSPQAGLVSDGADNLWGTTAFGGVNVQGTVFKVNESTGTITTVVDFDGSFDPSDNARGQQPQAALASDGAGNLWSTTSGGGIDGAGTVFEVNEATGAITTVLDFDASNDPTDNDRGADPIAGLVSDGTGNLWGTTYSGGVSNNGTVFEVNESTGVITTVVDFDGLPNMSDNERGSGPVTGLASDGAGNLWGTTQVGGVYANGTLFKVSEATGAITTVVDFDGSTNTADNARGANPQAGLASDGAGNLWGTAGGGGANNAGTVFEVNISTGAITTLFDFTRISGSVPGTGPYGWLLFTGSGFYGTTNLGGITSSGLPAGGGELFFISLNTPPLAVNTSAVITGTGAVTIFPLAGDSDPSGATFSITSVSQPSQGTVTWTGTSITYMPNGSYANYAGHDTFTYTITDSNGQTATAEVTVGNPYYLQKGNFGGVLGNTGGGYITLTTNATGAFSGKLRAGKANYSLTGKFGPSAGGWFGIVGGEPLTLQFDAANLIGSQYGQYEITGSYNGVGFTAYHALYNSATNPAPEVGTYNILIAPPAQVSLAAATASVTVTNGKVTGLTLTGSGSGYISVPTVTISSTSGGGAAATAIISNGSVSGLTITGAGKNYPASGVTAKITAPSGNPQGYGYATVTVSESGNVTISGKLGDGTVFTDGVYITGGTDAYAEGFPVYTPLAYKAAGSLVGTVAFEDIPGVSDCDGTLTWVKPAQTSTAFFTAGFTTTVAASGGAYVKPPLGSLALPVGNTSPNAIITLSEPDFANTITHHLFISPGSSANADTVTVTDPGTDALTLSINASNGSVGGSFINPVTGTKVSISGLILYKQTKSGGYFTTATQSGNMVITAP